MYRLPNGQMKIEDFVLPFEGKLIPRIAGLSYLSLFPGKRSKGIMLSSSHFTERLPRLKNEIVLFIGAGLFATSILYSHLGNYVPHILNLIVGSNALSLAVVIIFGSLILSVLGVHPIITVTFLEEPLKPLLTA